MTLTRSLIITATWMAIAALLALALTYPALLAVAGLITMFGCIAAADRRPKRQITAPDRPVSVLGVDAQGKVGPELETLPTGFMRRFSEAGHG